MWNLCRNALRYCQRKAGSIRIELRAGVMANTVELTVSDDGPGVPEAIRPHLFEPFFTTAASGTGLGLYIAREICDANNASLDYRRACRSGRAVRDRNQGSQELKRSERSGSGGRATAPQRCVLVVDDEVDILELIELTLLRMGLDVERAMACKDAQAKLAGPRHYDLCLTDMRLPDGTGLEIVEHITKGSFDLPVAVITAHGNTENAVAALKAGAFDYVSKPVSLDQLRTLVKSALSLPKVGEIKSAEVAAGEKGLLGNSAAIVHVRDLIEKLARSEAPVHITGESGSGKELAARLIHQKSARRDRPFVPVNCGAIPENLMESEFFGYKKGAFTGADSDRDGFFQAANGGTLFLDEVADLPLPMQVKLLRAIQEKKARKVGSTQEDAVDVRIISATHQNLADCVESGKFRHDLYYRLNVIELRMPALRDMREDIPAIASAVLDKLAAQAKVARPELEEQSMQALAQYDFPGNVRELENILERAMALCDGQRITCRRPAAHPARGGGGRAHRRGLGGQVAAAGIPRPGGEGGHSGGPGEDPLQPHGGRQAAGHHLPRHALPHGAARHQLKPQRPRGGRPSNAHDRTCFRCPRRCSRVRRRACRRAARTCSAPGRRRARPPAIACMSACRTRARPRSSRSTISSCPASPTRRGRSTTMASGP